MFPAGLWSNIQMKSRPSSASGSTHTFFPVSQQIEEIVLSWLQYLRERLNFDGEDPLFPKTAMAHDENDCFTPDGLTREFWSSAEPVRKVFRTAFERAGMPNYTPHSFRRTLVSIAYQRELSPAHLKAWSQNLGHESMLTTLTSYGNIGVHQQGELVKKTPFRTLLLKQLLGKILRKFCQIEDSDA